MPIKAIIVDDERLARTELKKLLQEFPDIHVIDEAANVDEGVEKVETQSPDLIFLDIQMPGKTGFDLLGELDKAPHVIFTTAYDEYWQEAFEHNSIDYLLKPIKQEKLETALSKYHRLKEHFAGNLQNLLNWQKGNSAYKKKFLVKRGSDYISIKVEDIAYFYASHKVVCLVNNQSHKFILDESLSELEEQLDSSMVYRVNRKYLVNVNAIQRIRSYPKSKLQLDLVPAMEEEVLIAQENVASFKEWMNR